ncbi:MAG: signal peptide peptidase SppA [Gemmataceae bacterium]
MSRLLLALLFALAGWGSAPAQTSDKASASDADQPKEKAKPAVIAHIKLSGSLDESAPMADSLLGSLGENFKSRIDRLKKAGADKNVAAVLLEIDGLNAGWGKLHELRSAIEKLRASGKPVIGFVEGGAMKDYLLALSCDEVVIPEASMLMLTGLRTEVTFYKRLLEMVGIKADFVMMGDFKSAAEPYLRDKLSDANRKQLNEMIDDFYDNEIVGVIAKTRKLEPAVVRKLIDAGPYSPKAALKANLFDRIGYLDEIPESLKKRLNVAEVKLERDYGKPKDDDLDIFGLYRKLVFGPTKTSTSKADKVAVIYAVGAINTGKGGNNPLLGASMGAETMVKAIREAEEDKTVKAIVLRVDSPGGSALASDLIWKELKRCKKPVLASMSDVAASGGYYIAMAAKKIYAEPGTITGSIGVVGGKLALKGLYEKVGLDSEVITRGANSGIFSDEPFTDAQKAAFKAMMEDTYDLFLDKALEGRHLAGKKMTRDQLKALAGGRIWTGRQALANGLIDQLGTLEEAIAEAAKLGGLAADKEPELLLLPKPKASLDSLLSGFGLEVIRLLGENPRLTEKVRGIGMFLNKEKEHIWAIAPYQLSFK